MRLDPEFRRRLLALALLVAVSFAAGFYFDRSLHRPIEIHVSQAETGDSGIWPRGAVCDAFDRICWKTT